MPGLSSDVIACVVKLMSNDDLIAVGRKVFNPLPGSNIGASGYMGARIQPNSPTDDPEDIVMQVLDGWSYAVGDVVLGTNPVSSDVDQVAAIELALRDLLATFELEDVLPHCVLAHVDVQAQVEEKFPGSTALVVPEPRGRRRRQRRVRHQRREDAPRMRRSAPGASACTSRPARAPTRPTATARASTW